MADLLPTGDRDREVGPQRLLQSLNHPSEYCIFFVFDSEEITRNYKGALAANLVALPWPTDILDRSDPSTTPMIRYPRGRRSITPPIFALTPSCGQGLVLNLEAGLETGRASFDELGQTCISLSRKDVGLDAPSGRKVSTGPTGTSRNPSSSAQRARSARSVQRAQHGKLSMICVPISGSRHMPVGFVRLPVRWPGKAVPTIEYCRAGSQPGGPDELQHARCADRRGVAPRPSHATAKVCGRSFLIRNSGSAIEVRASAIMVFRRKTLRSWSRPPSAPSLRLVPVMRVEDDRGLAGELG